MSGAPPRLASKLAAHVGGGGGVAGRAAAAAGARRGAAKGSGSRHLRGSFSDIFKHTILVKTLPALTTTNASPLTFFDLSCSLPAARINASNPFYKEGLKLIYEHAQDKFAKQTSNPFQGYIASLKKFSGIKGGSMVPPSNDDPESFPTWYPNAVGFASLFMREHDRAVLVSRDRYVTEKMVETYGRDPRFEIVHEVPSPRFASVRLPPLTRNGLVWFDLDQTFQYQPGVTEKVGYENYLSTSADVLLEACRRWPRATFIVPYSLTPGQEVGDLNFFRKIMQTGMQYILDCHMYVETEERGVGCVIINPPTGVDRQLEHTLPLLKTEVLTRGQLVRLEEFSDAEVTWLTKRFFSSEHDTVSKARLSWQYSNRLASRPVREKDGSEPMHPDQWKYHLEKDPEDFAEELRDLADGYRKPDKVDLTPDEARRFANIVKGDN